jgi:hypothetical protein
MFLFILLLPLIGIFNQAFAISAPSTFQGMLINSDMMEREDKVVELKQPASYCRQSYYLSRKKTIRSRRKCFVYYSKGNNWW